MLRSTSAPLHYPRHIRTASASICGANLAPALLSLEKQEASAPGRGISESCHVRLEIRDRVESPSRLDHDAGDALRVGNAESFEDRVFATLTVELEQIAVATHQGERGPYVDQVHV